MLEQPPLSVVDWSRGNISEWLRFEEEDATEDAERGGDSDANPIVGAAPRALLFRTRVTLLHDINAKLYTTGQFACVPHGMELFRDQFHPRKTALEMQEE